MLTSSPTMMVMSLLYRVDSVQVAPAQMMSSLQSQLCPHAYTVSVTARNMVGEGPPDTAGPISK